MHVHYSGSLNLIIYVDTDNFDSSGILETVVWFAKHIFKM